MSCWYKPTGINQGYVSSGSINDTYCLFLNGNTDARFRTSAGAAVAIFTPPVTMSTGTWYHLLMYRSGSNVYYFQNAIASPSNPIAPPIGNLTVDRLGVRQNLTVPLDGAMDELGIANVAPTSQQITDLYNGGSGADFATIMGSGNTLLHYKFNESGTDTTAVDSSVNGNDGALVSFPASGMWVAH